VSRTDDVKDYFFDNDVSSIFIYIWWRQWFLYYWCCFWI